MPAIAALAASACINTSAIAAEELPANIKTIAVVSAIGDEVINRKIGFSAFGNKTTSLPTADWGFDDLIAEETKKLLGPGFTFVEATYDRANFYDYGTRPSFLGMASPTDRWDKLQLPPETDAVLFAVKIHLEDPVGRTNQYLHGLGIYRYGVRRAIYALYELYLVDAHTKRTLASEWARVPKPAMFGKRLAWLERDATLDAETAEELTPEQREILKTSMRDLLSISMAQTIGMMVRLPQPPPTEDVPPTPSQGEGTEQAPANQPHPEP